MGVSDDRNLERNELKSLTPLSAAAAGPREQDHRSVGALLAVYGPREEPPEHESHSAEQTDVEDGDPPPAAEARVVAAAGATHGCC